MHVPAAATLPAGRVMPVPSAWNIAWEVPPDVTKAGTVIGYDILDFVQNSTNTGASGNVTLDAIGGARWFLAPNRSRVVDLAADELCWSKAARSGWSAYIAKRQDLLAPAAGAAGQSQAVLALRVLGARLGPLVRLRVPQVGHVVKLEGDFILASIDLACPRCARVLIPIQVLRHMRGQREID